MHQDLGTIGTPAESHADPAAATAAAEDLDHAPVPRAAWAAVVVGALGMLSISCLFLFGGPLVGFLSNPRDGSLGLVLGSLLLASAGGYGLLMFYGGRLRWLWARRRRAGRHGPPGSDGSPLRLALGDLRRIRWLAAAVLLAVLPVYLVPPSRVAFVGPTWGSGYYAREVSHEMTRLAVVAWVGLAAVPVLAARRAAWEIAAAGGDLAGPADVPGFQVMVPGGGPPPPPPLAVRPVSELPVAEIVVPDRPEPTSPAGTTTPAAAEVVPLAAVAPSRVAALPHSAAPPHSASPTHSPAAHDAEAGRDWETVLLVLLVLVLAAAVVRVDATRGAWREAVDPSVWGARYTYFAQYRFSGSAVPPSGPTEALTGMAGLVTLAAPVALWFTHVLGIVWAAACLMAGPRFRRPATLVAGFAVAAIAAQLAAHLYLADLYTEYYRQFTPMVGTGTVPGGWVEDSRAAPDVTGYLFQMMPLVALLVVMTRPAVRELYDRRVRRCRHG